MSTVLVTHVGSLPRTQQTVDFIFNREHGKPYDVDAFETHLTEAVSETVKRQVDAGVDIVSDGETSKISYATYIKDRYSGFSGDSPRNAPNDLKQFPHFLKKIAQSGGTPEYARPMCTAEIKSINSSELHRDIHNLKAAIHQHGAKRGFMNAPSPATVALFLQNNHYSSRTRYLEALADALTAEYEAIAKADLDLQIDCPDLALSRHMLFNDLSDDEFVRIAEENIEILNHALRRIPQHKIRLHICWGNYEGPHCCDIDMDQVFGLLMKTRSTYLLFESSNPRHAHEWEVFSARRNEIPADRILVPGVVDTTCNFIEHPKLIAQRLSRFVDIVGKDRVYAGSDCGFGTFAGFGSVDGDIAYAKLNAIRQGADLI